MEQHVYSVRSFLPVQFQEPDTNDFVDYMVNTYLENLPNQKFQFSFTAFHMLYMSYIYKIKWFLRKQGNIDIETSLQDFIRANKGTAFNTLFDLSQIAEKTAIDKLLKTLSFHINDVDTCKNLVEVRNKCSHASGKIYYKKFHQIETYILEELDSVNAIHRKVSPLILPIIDEFIEKTWGKTWIASDIQNWIIENYLSQQDILIILNTKPSFLKDNSDTKEIVYKKVLYINIVSELQKHLSEKGDHFTKSLSALMKGLRKKIDVRSNPGDAEKWKTSQEIIEEQIVPLLTEIAEEEAIKAQTILKLVDSY